MHTVRFSLTGDDFVEHAAFARPGMTSLADTTRRATIRSLAWTALMGVGISAVIAYRAGPEPLTMVFAFVVCGAIFSVVVLLLTLVGKTVLRSGQAVNTAMRTAAERGELGAIGIETTLSLTERGVHAASHRDEITTFWHGIEGIEQTANLILLLTWKTSGYIVPKRAFASPADMEAFLAFARQQWLAARPSQDAPPTSRGPLIDPVRLASKQS